MYTYDIFNLSYFSDLLIGLTFFVFMLLINNWFIYNLVID